MTGASFSPTLINVGAVIFERFSAMLICGGRQKRTIGNSVSNICPLSKECRAFFTSSDVFRRDESRIAHQFLRLLPKLPFLWLSWTAAFNPSAYSSRKLLKAEDATTRASIIPGVRALKSTAKGSAEDKPIIDAFSIPKNFSS